MKRNNKNYSTNISPKKTRSFNNKLNLISIGICTKNNYKLLDRCLNSIYNLTIPQKIQIQVIIIDQSNKKFQINFPHIKGFVFEQLSSQHSGISFARNELFEHANGEILFITDDDTVVSHDWLISTLLIFTQNKKVGIIGGKIKQLNKTPKYFIKTLKEIGYNKNFWPYALLDLGEGIITIDKNTPYPCFANMAVRKKIYKNIRIDTDFGNQERFFKIFGGEDPAFVEEVKKTHSLLYNSEMIVRHYIKPHKFSRKYFIWRYFEWGKERALLKTKYNIQINGNFALLFNNIINLFRNLKNNKTYLNELLQIVFLISFIFTSFLFKISNILKKS